MSDITKARPFTKPEQVPLTFVISIGDLQRDWTLSLEARERIMIECAERWGWSHEELVTNIVSLRAQSSMVKTTPGYTK